MPRLNAYNLVLGGVDLTPALLSLTWGGTVAELPDKCTATAGAHPRRDVGLGDAFVNGAPGRVRANGADLFHGPAFAVEAVEGPGAAAYQLEAYDPLIYLTKSEDDLYATGGTSNALLEKIERKWAVPIVASDMPSIYLPTKSFVGETAGSVLQYLMELCALFSGEPYYLRWEGGVAIRRLAPGGPVADLRPHNAQLVRARSDIEGLVSAVKVVGSFPTDSPDAPPLTGGADPDQPVTPVEVPPVIRGPSYVSQYGKIQKVLKSSDFPDEATANRVADDVLRVYGQPRIVATWVAYDQPHVRKGDTVSADVGAARGAFVVTGIEHDAASQLMTITSDSQSLLHLRLTGPTDPRGSGAPQPPSPLPEGEPT